MQRACSCSALTCVAPFRDPQAQPRRQSLAGRLKVSPCRLALNTLTWGRGSWPAVVGPESGAHGPVCFCLLDGWRRQVAERLLQAAPSELGAAESNWHNPPHPRAVSQPAQAAELAEFQVSRPAGWHRAGVGHGFLWSVVITRRDGRVVKEPRSWQQRRRRGFEVNQTVGPSPFGDGSSIPRSSGKRGPFSAQQRELSNGGPQERLPAHRACLGCRSVPGPSRCQKERREVTALPAVAW